MTEDWKARLIDSLRGEAPGDGGAAAREQALELTFSRLVDAVGAAIGVIAEGAGVAAGIQGSKRDGRVRWTHRGRHLAVRLDRAVGRCVLAIDTGREWSQSEVLPAPTLGAAQEGPSLVDGDGAPVLLDELTERFVTRLFAP